MTRTEGFYWVKQQTRKASTWVVAQYLGGEWYSCGSEVPGIDADYDVWAEMLTAPNFTPPQHEHLKEEKEDRRSGANGMKAGDRVVYMYDGRHGVATEFLPDGDADVTFDDGTYGCVKWRLLEPEHART